MATPPQLTTPASLPNLATVSSIAFFTISYDHMYAIRSTPFEHILYTVIENTSDVTSMDPLGAKTLPPSSLTTSALLMDISL